MAETDYNLAELRLKVPVPLKHRLETMALKASEAEGRRVSTSEYVVNLLSRFVERLGSPSVVKPRGEL